MPIFGGAFTLFEFVGSSDDAGSSPRQGEQDVNSGKKTSSSLFVQRTESAVNVVIYALFSGVMPGSYPHTLYYTIRI